MGNYFIAAFDDQQAVYEKIEELKNQGYSEADMYVMAHNKEEISMVRGRTNVDSAVSEGKWINRFSRFLNGRENMGKAFASMGITEEEAQGYYRKVQDGKLLLYVSENYDERYKAVGGDSFRLGEKEKTNLQNEKLDMEESPGQRARREEEKVELDARQYEGAKRPNAEE